MNKNQLQIIKSKIKLLSNQSGYHVRFNKRVSEKEVKKFEYKFEFKLPQDYRDFIIQIGNGGFNFDFFDLNHFVYRVDKNNRIKRDFPLNKALIEFDEDLDDHINIVNYDFNKFENYKSDFNDLYNGQLILQDNGCGNYTFLVVNGAEYGNVWIWEYPSNGEILPYHSLSWKDRFKTVQRKKFNDWMIDKLNAQLEKYTF